MGQTTSMHPSKLATSDPVVLDDPARSTVETALDRLGESAEQVSLAIEMPKLYLRTYLERGLPQTLPLRVRRRLAAYLGVPVYALT